MGDFMSRRLFLCLVPPRRPRPIATPPTTNSHAAPPDRDAPPAAHPQPLLSPPAASGAASLPASDAASPPLMLRVRGRQLGLLAESDLERGRHVAPDRALDYALGDHPNRKQGAYVRRCNLVSYTKDDLAKARDHIVRLAQMEGLEGHAHSVEIRMR